MKKIMFFFILSVVFILNQSPIRAEYPDLFENIIETDKVRGLYFGGVSELRPLLPEMRSSGLNTALVKFSWYVSSEISNSSNVQTTVNAYKNWGGWCSDNSTYFVPSINYWGGAELELLSDDINKLYLVTPTGSGVIVKCCV
jgi:hypothetical protein